jgi:hypothetical protein
MKTLAAVFIAAPLFAQQAPIADAIRAAYERVKTNVIESAAAMPEESYPFRPTPQQRPFSEWLTHTASGNYAFCAGIRGVNAPSDTHAVESATTKADIQQALRASFDYCDASLKEANDQSPARPMVNLIASLNEHYGNMVGYMRAKGIVPPSTARSAASKNGSKK